MKKSKIITCGLIMLAAVVCRSAAGSAAAPANAPTKTQAAIPAKAAAGAPAKVPAKAAAAAPAQATAGTPVKAPAEVPAKASSWESYRYNPAGKPDPFVPFIEKEMMLQKKAARKSSGSIFPLQNANVDQFKLVGIAGDERRRTAVVEDERGRFYTLKAGTAIGRNHGSVKSVLADRVIVEEKVRTDTGGTRINRITMKLHKEDNEGKP